jgi:DNA-binding LytR/AlgR family response regulator
MSSIKILIVEDEILIAEDIASRLLKMGYHIANITDNVDAAIDCLEKDPVDIVLIDIALQDTKTGIDLADSINNKFRLPFIFLTSLSDEKTIEKARITKPAAYLLKPFNDNQVRISVEMALFNFYEDGNTASASIEQSENKEQLLKMPGALFLKKDTHYDKVEFCNILWLEADSNYTFIHTKTEKYIYSIVLKNFEDKLPHDTFIRVHRSYIVNLSCITGFEGNMLMVGKKFIPVNKSTRDEVFRRFQVI